MMSSNRTTSEERRLDSQVALSPQPWQIEPACLSSLPELPDLSVVEVDVASSVLDDVPFPTKDAKSALAGKVDEKEARV